MTTGATTPLAMPGPGDNQHPMLCDVFTPTRPQRSARRLTGRQSELSRIFRALTVERAHVVLYGERGRGKTSIVNLVAGSARSAGYMVAHYACSMESDFDEIVRGLARDLPPPLLAVPIQQGPHLRGCEGALPAERIQPRDIVGLCGRLTGRHLILIVDEFDRVQNFETRTRFADTIKQVSDRGAALSFVIVGVSDSLEELLGQHPSIQRNVLGLPLPLLSDEQVREILARGGKEAGIHFPPEIEQAIVTTARGVPYIAQLLGLHAGSEALDRRSVEVNMGDFATACMRALEEMDPRVAASFSRLMSRGGEIDIGSALLAVVAGQHDRFGRFAVEPAANGWCVAGRLLTKDQWSLMVDMGTVRECHSAGFGIFAFADAMLQPYILLRHLVVPPRGGTMSAGAQAPSTNDAVSAPSGLVEAGAVQGQAPRVEVVSARQGSLGPARVASVQANG
jgi:Cdc6-like AAA superfamily ATPase